MKRILVDLPEESLEDLDKIAKKQKVSRAELLRRAIALVIQSQKSQEKEKKLEAFCGLWKDKPMSDNEIDRLREEWEKK